MHTKLCKHCGAEKCVDQFGCDKSKRDGLTYSCKDCIREYKLKYDKKHGRRVIPSAEKPKKLMSVKLEKAREYRAKNAEKVRAIYRAYKKANKHVVNAINSRRRAAQIQAVPPWADLEQIREIYKQAQDMTSSTGVLHHVDHIVPLISDVVCGLHVTTNLQVLPAIANLKKSNSFVDALWAA